MSIESSPDDKANAAGNRPADSAVRHRVIGLSFLAVIICYMDRTNLSIAIIPMAEQFQWDKATTGVILSSFFFGYVTTQILGGWLADNFGGKLVLGVGVVLWSIFTMLTAPAAIFFGAIGIVVARVTMGLGEGVTFPAVYSILSNWTPVTERARAISFTMSGIEVGTIAALLLTPPIIVRLGWEYVFYLFGMLGICWWIAWHFLVSSTPEKHTRISPAETALIRADSNSLPDRVKLPLRAMFSHSAVWAIIVAYFCANWVSFVFLAWFPTYVYEELGVDLASVGFVAVGPALIGAIGMNCWGWVADSLLRRDISIIAVRKIMNSAGVGASAAMLFTIGFISSVPLIITLMCLSSFFGSAAMSGMGANPLDIAPRHAGTLMGIVNSIASIPGIIGVAATGLILDATGSWTLVFWSLGGVATFGMITFAIFASSDRLFE